MTHPIRIAAAASVAAVGLIAFAGPAIAWTGAVSVSEPACIPTNDGATLYAVARVTVANKEDTTALVQTTTDQQVYVPGHESRSFNERANGATYTVTFTWKDEAGQTLDRKDYPYTLPTRTSESCTATPTTTPPTTVPTTAPAVVTVPPDVPETTAPTTVPTTAPELPAPPTVATTQPPVATTVERPMALPATGGEATRNAVIAMALVLGGVLLVMVRRHA